MNQRRNGRIEFPSTGVRLSAWESPEIHNRPVLSRKECRPRIGTVTGHHQSHFGVFSPTHLVKTMNHLYNPATYRLRTLVDCIAIAIPTVDITPSFWGSSVFVFP